MSHVDPSGFSAIAYRTHRFCNPVSPPLVERALEFAALRPGERAADLGCGNAEMALHLAERHGLAVDAVEISAAMQALARERMDGRGAPGKVTLHGAAAEAFLDKAEPYDLILAVGAYALFRDAAGPEAVFSRLGRHLAPGGRLLFGDPFWRRPPSEKLARLLPGYPAFAGYVAAGEAAGLTAAFAGESPQLDWDDYAWRMEQAVRSHAREHPGPEADALMARARMNRDIYLAEARDALGFGLYLFRRP